MESLLLDVYPPLTSSVAVQVNCLLASSFTISDSVNVFLLVEYEYLGSVGLLVKSTRQLYMKLRLWLLGVVVEVLVHVNVTRSPTAGLPVTDIEGCVAVPVTR